MEASQVRYIVVHCSASPPHAKVDASVIDRWHRQRGFRRIGYHYVINRDGVVELGRMLDEAGAHAYGFNDQSVGICLVGGVNRAGKAENNFTPAQFEELKAKLEELLVKFPKAQIVGHRDLPGVKKDCPSFDVRTWWAQENQA
jgi:N-acetylmuramoyl-L-alanine amidase